MKKDIISKEIVLEIAKDIATYILNIDVKSIDLINSENVRVESRRADIVAIVNRNTILHLEVQNNNDFNMPYRMLRYWLDIKNHYKLPIKQYVIYIGKDKCKMKNILIEDNVNYSYNLIDMKTINCNFLLNQDKPEAIVLAILCDFKGKDEKEIVKEIIKKIKVLSKDENSFRKYIFMLEELSENRNLKDIVKEVEMLSEIDITKLPSYEIGLEEGIEKGIEKGIIKGKILAFKELGLDEKEIANKLNIDIKEVKKIIDENMHF